MVEFSGSGSGADSDIYTLLMGIALLALLIGAGYLWYTGSGMFGGSFPF